MKFEIGSPVYYLRVKLYFIALNECFCTGNQFHKILTTILIKTKLFKDAKVVFWISYIWSSSLVGRQYIYGNSCCKILTRLQHLAYFLTLITKMENKSGVRFFFLLARTSNKNLLYSFLVSKKGRENPFCQNIEVVM